MHYQIATRLDIYTDDKKIHVRQTRYCEKCTNFLLRCYRDTLHSWINVPLSLINWKW